MTDQASSFTRLITGIRRSMSASSIPKGGVDEEGDLVTLTKEQIKELYEFMEEAKFNRDRRIPSLEASLAEANASLAKQAQTRSSILRQLKANRPERKVHEDEISLKPLFLSPPEEPGQLPLPGNNKHLLDNGSEPEEIEENPALLLSEMSNRLQRLEVDNREMRETIERYEIAVAMYKGDKHMLLTEALRKAFTCPQYSLSLLSQEQQQQLGSAKSEIETVGIETDAEVMVKPPNIANESVETDAMTVESVVPDEMDSMVMLMMEGSWMYKYPRRRFHRLIGLPCVPLGKLTHRFFWFCPGVRSVIWSDSKTLFRSDSCKIIRVKDVLCEKRQIDRSSWNYNGQDKVEVLVIIPEAGLPLALIPTSAAEFRAWKKGLFALVGKACE